jgi:hypothetical protein
VRWPPTRKKLYRVAAGSAAEVRTGLALTTTWGYIAQSQAAPASALLDRIVAIFWRVTHPKRRRPVGNPSVFSDRMCRGTLNPSNSSACLSDRDEWFRAHPLLRAASPWRGGRATSTSPGSRSRRLCTVSCASTCARCTRRWSMASRGQACPISFAPTSRVTYDVACSGEASPTCSAKTVAVRCWWRFRVAAAVSAPRAWAAACAKEHSIC